MSEQLNTYEIKTLKLIHKKLNGLIPNYSTFKAKMDDFGYDIEELYEFYKLYINNYRKEADYENVVNPKKGDIKLIDSIKQIIKNPNMNYDDMVKLFDHRDIIGDWFDGIGEKSSWRSTYNNFDVDESGIFLYLNNEDWEKYFSGLSEDDLWYYNRIGASSYEHYYDEQDSDEFRYALNGYPQEYRENLSQLARMVGDLQFAETILKGEEEEGEFSEFLEKYFPEVESTISSDYLTEIGYIVGTARVKGVEECYENEIVYKSKGNAEVFIPWRNLLDLVVSKEIFTLSDLKDAEINGDGIGLDNCWWDSYPSAEEYKDAYNSINSHIENLIEELDSGDFSDSVKSRVQIAQDMWDIVNKLKFKKQGNVFVKTTPNKINFTIESFDTEKGTFKVRITYPKKYGTSKWGNTGSQETKIVKYEDLGNLVSSLPLDRQVENFKQIFKKVIKEETISPFTKKDEEVVKKFLKGMDLDPIDSWPSEYNGYTWYVEFYDTLNDENNDFTENFIYAFNSHESLSKFDESDNLTFIESISNYILDNLGYNHTNYEDIFKVVKKMINEISESYLKSQGHNPYEYHLEDID
jgi:hypothetical protein